MNDKEMTIRAAKVAGIAGSWDDEKKCIVMPTPDSYGKVTWNPLHDMGDALRLAVRRLQDHRLYYSVEDYVAAHNDELLATCRAIVREVAGQCPAPAYRLYVTYGGCTNLRDHFSVVEGDDWGDCRKKIDCATGGQFAFAYEEADFAGQPEKYNLTEVPLQPQVML